MRIAREVHDALAIQLEVAEALLVEGHEVEGATERIRRSRQPVVHYAYRHGIVTRSSPE